MKETWFSIDVESSGSVPGLYNLVSIGACVVNPERHRPEFYKEIIPHGGMVDPEATGVHGLTSEYLKEHGVDPKIAITQFVDWVVSVAGDTRPVFGSWSTFDWMWMGYYLEKFGKRYTYPFGPSSLEFKSYYLGLVKGTEWRVTAKGRMPKDDLSGKHTHNALADAIEQAEMVEGWQKKYGKDATTADFGPDM